MLILGVGMWDDVMRMRPRNKLVAQVVVASISMLYGFVIPGINNPFDRNPGTNWIDFPLWVGVPLTLLWYVGMMNAINFIDGLDGLLAGVAAISSIFLFAIAVLHANPVVALVVIALAGAALGFLPYNFNPARIILGDAGSLFIGYVFATVSIIGASKTAIAIGLVVPLLVLALPVLDTAAAIVPARDRRQTNHRSRSRTLSPPADLPLRTERAPGGAADLRGLLRARRGGARLLRRVHARLHGTYHDAGRSCAS